MAKTLQHTDQFANIASLTEIAPSALTPVDTILSNINTIVKEPLSLSISDITLTVGNSIITTGPSGKQHGLYQINSIDIGNVTGTINFNTGSVSGAVQSVTLPTMTASYYIRAGIEIRSDKKIYVIFGTEAVSASACGAPIFTSGATQIGEITLQDDSTGGQGHFSNGTMSDIVQYKLTEQSSGKAPEPNVIQTIGAGSSLNIDFNSTQTAIEFHYSARRATGLQTEVGMLLLCTDGTSVSIGQSVSNTGSTGLTFTASLNSGSIRLTATNAGSPNEYSVKLKYWTSAWDVA